MNTVHFTSGTWRGVGAQKLPGKEPSAGWSRAAVVDNVTCSKALSFVTDGFIQV